MAWLTAMIASSGEKAVTGMMGFVLGTLDESEIATWMWFDNSLFKMNILIACAIAAGVVASRRHADLHLLLSTPITRWGWFCLQVSGIVLAYTVIYVVTHLIVPFIFGAMVDGLDVVKFFRLSVMALFSSITAVVFAMLASTIAKRAASAYGLSIVFLMLLGMPSGFRYTFPWLKNLIPYTPTWPFASYFETGNLQSTGGIVGTITIYAAWILIPIALSCIILQSEGRDRKYKSVKTIRPVSSKSRGLSSNLLWVDFTREAFRLRTVALAFAFALLGVVVPLLIYHGPREMLEFVAFIFKLTSGGEITPGLVALLMFFEMSGATFGTFLAVGFALLVISSPREEGWLTAALVAGSRRSSFLKRRFLVAFGTFLIPVIIGMLVFTVVGFSLFEMDATAIFTIAVLLILYLAGNFAIVVLVTTFIEDIAASILAGAVLIVLMSLPLILDLYLENGFAPAVCFPGHYFDKFVFAYIGSPGVPWDLWWVAVGAQAGFAALVIGLAFIIFEGRDL